MNKQKELFPADPSPGKVIPQRKIGRQKTIERTRQKLLGVSGKTLAARTMRTVNNMRAQCVGIGLAFEDIDMGVVAAGEELQAAMDEFEEAVKASVEWLKEGELYT